MPQGRFVENNYVVHALPSQGADETSAEGFRQGLLGADGTSRYVVWAQPMSKLLFHCSMKSIGTNFARTAHLQFRLDES